MLSRLEWFVLAMPNQFLLISVHRMAFSTEDFCYVTIGGQLSHPFTLINSHDGLAILARSHHFDVLEDGGNGDVDTAASPAATMIAESSSLRCCDHLMHWRWPSELYILLRSNVCHG